MRLKKGLFGALRFPAQCILCGALHRHSMAMCINCIPLLTKLKDSCYLCANPLPDAHGKLCGQCAKAPPMYSRAFVSYHYVPPMCGLLHRYKYLHQTFLAEEFALLMMEHIPDFLALAEIFIPVPVHLNKLRSRGFSPVAELTRRLVSHCDLPCWLTHCTKTRNTIAQVGLNKKQRRENPKGSFHCRPLEGQRVIIVDDLMTTGSTLNEVSRVLMEAGASEVFAWCLARAVV